MTHVLLITRYPILDVKSIAYLKDFNPDPAVPTMELEYTYDLNEAMHFGNEVHVVMKWLRSTIGNAYGINVVLNGHKQ